MVDAIVNQKARPLHKGTGVQGTYRKIVNPVAMNLTLILVRYGEFGSPFGTAC